MANTMPEIHYLTSPVFELLAAMFRVTTHERIELDDSRNFKGKPFELKQWVEQKRAILPQNVKDELDVFFNYESYLGLTLIRFAWDEKNYHDIDSFLESLKQFPSQKLFSYFLHTGYGPEGTINPLNLESTTANIDSSNLPEQEKWKLLYLYVHKEETKERLVKLLHDFSQIIEDELSGFMEKQRITINRVKSFAEAYGEEKFLQLISKKYQMPVDQMDEVVLAPSVFYDDWSFTTSTENFCLFLFGIKQLPFEESGYSADRDKVDQAFRVLADEKRISIIRLLNQSPLYGYELGQRLHLSNSTISHHLSSLAHYGLVRPVRKENRIYYEVRDKQIKKLMSQMLQSLVKDQD
ncbi:ArsR family transcriptional regulator [Sporolactobacillus shoreae]|uniref:ArsR family transcriptional regulator n=1 Tax=Sporolactobacillus shoreae TaxID=1465501 RepID=A0A4Z0GM56_9BACL|nr:metalloregulator ArsR/SmtB family transcription factor [Sporolactobacillus shoreae]TGA97157.1 ArsR family transcriptional regulator [Sporolactobacillus shoreae]